MSDFQIGDELEWKGLNDGERRTVTEVTHDRVHYMRSGTFEGVYRDSVSLDYAKRKFRAVKRRPPAAPESFRQVFCAWTGQTPEPKPPTRTPLQRAEWALRYYISGGDVRTDHLSALIGAVVDAAKAEALAVGVDVRAVCFEVTGPGEAERLAVSTLDTFGKLAPRGGGSLARERLRLVRVPV